MSSDINKKTEEFMKFIKNLKASLTLKLTAIITIIILLISTISSFTIYKLSFKALKNEIRNNLVLLSANAAASIDFNLLVTIKSPKDEGNKIYLTLQKSLQNIKNASSGKIRYVYTLTKANGKYIYILDASPISDKVNHSSIGQQFIADNYTYIENAYKKKIATAEIIASPDPVYGGLIQTGYAPIIGQNGKVVGILGMDMDVTVLSQKEKSMKAAGIIAIMLAFILAVFSGIIFTRYLTKPIHALIKGAKRVAEGDLDTIVNINRSDELGLLADTFNGMALDLKISQEQLKKYSLELENKFTQTTTLNQELNFEIIERKRTEELLANKNYELEDSNSKLKNAQQQIIQHEKMASIGQLAAGVAHEINNPMGFISSNIESLRKYTDKIFEFIIAQEKFIIELAGSIENGDYDNIPIILSKINTLKNSLRIIHIIKDTGDLITETLNGADRVKP
jgi:methyl-accepting chemotaxis protein